MMVVGFALAAAGVLLLYWMYVGGKGGQPASISGPPAAYGPVPGAPDPYGAIG